MRLTAFAPLLRASTGDSVGSPEVRLLLFSGNQLVRERLRADGMENSFSDRLAAAVRRCGNAVVVGIDPRFEGLPEPLRALREEGLTARAHAFADFGRGVIDVVAPLVPAVKPQAAFFEQLGPAGMQALADVINYAREKDLLVIVDGKRNDIGTTAEAYARAFLGADSAWHADALTVSPYLGTDSLEPFVEVATARGAGIFVLVKTSNPGGGVFQDIDASGKPLYLRVADQVEQFAAKSVGECGYGVVGAVAGATYPEQLEQLRSAMPHTWFLVPGYGAQGGGAADVAAAFDDRGLGAVVNNSRGIIFAHARQPYCQRYSPAQWQDAVEAATKDMIEELRRETSTARL